MKNKDINMGNKHKLSNHIRALLFSFDDKDKQDEIRKIAKRVEEMESFISDISSDFDCDSDAHRYGTTCRCCYREMYISSCLI